jgi:Protein of unknown function (DUF3800)
LYLYLDESGNPSLNFDDPKFRAPGAMPFLVFALVAIEDKRTKIRIERIIRQTIRDAVRYCKQHHAGQVPSEFTQARGKRAVLKGHRLATCLPIRRKLFERLGESSLHWYAHIVLYDKRTLKPVLPRHEGRRYAVLFKGVVKGFCFPKNERFVPLIVDRRYEGLRSSANLRRQFNQMILRTFRRARHEKSRTVLKVFHAEPDLAVPLQLADILANFGYERLHLDEPLLTTKNRKQMEKRISVRERRISEWNECFTNMKAKLSLRKPKYFLSRKRKKSPELLFPAAT